MIILPRLIVLDRSECRLDFYHWYREGRRYTRAHTYPVTVGKVGSETPHGVYYVQAKTRKPDWKMPPHPDYPEHEWGKIFPFGQSGNPFEGGFIALAGRVTGIGLHGTSFDPQIGTQSSHGCVRMLTPDLLEIYDLCSIGMPVYLH